MTLRATRLTAAADEPNAELADPDARALHRALRSVGMMLSATVDDPDAPFVQPCGGGLALMWNTGCVRLKPSRRREVLERAGLRILKQLHFAPNLFMVRGRNHAHLTAMKSLLDGAGDTEYFELECTFTAPPRGSMQAGPSQDPRVVEQPYLESMGIQRAWTRSRGRGVAIGVVDGEFDVHSRELAPNWDWTRAAYLTIDPDEGPVFRTAAGPDEYPRLDHAVHGTRCAALAVAAENGFNGVGVAPDSQLVALATGLVTSPIMVARALAYCADPGSELDGVRRPGCAVIACSMADALTRDNHPVVQDALDFLLARDVLLVSAVSNTDPQVSMDRVSTHACAIATASVDEFGTRVAQGARGPELDCVAATEGIHGTSINDVWEFLEGGNSWSAPVVAGVVALVRAAYPGEDAATIRARILESCVDLGNPIEFGRGLVQADGALGM